MKLPLGAVQVIIVGFITTALAIIALFLRLWSRRIQKVPLVFNDYMVIAGLVLGIGEVVTFRQDSFIGATGAHTSQITNPWVLATFAKVFTPGQLLWAAANTCVKFSILSLYTVLFPTKRFCYICYVTMGISLAYFTSVILEAFVLCKPVQYNWDKSIPGECTNQHLAFLLAGITNLLIDTLIVVLPMPKLFGLHMSLSRRLSIAGMFGLGAVIIIISLLRVLSLVSWNLDDVTYVFTRIAIYSIVEPTAGVVNACLPVIKPALQTIAGRRPGSTPRKEHQVIGKSDISTFGSCEHPLSKGDDYGHKFLRLDDGPFTAIHSEGASASTFEDNNAIQVTRVWGIDNPSGGA
ncbi:hypothetical protein F5Y01DRAFT_304100 [Xylaria sp. FL0043]|nr:hypothetical protein F5Y01DRAFT_304100 [Xylaria sp. FL0043]